MNMSQLCKIFKEWESEKDQENLIAGSFQFLLLKSKLRHVKQFGVYVSNRQLELAALNHQWLIQEPGKEIQELQRESTEAQKGNWL